MSALLQVLIPVKKFEVVLAKIQNHESFEGRLNAGVWGIKQFTSICINLDEYDIDTIQEDPRIPSICKKVDVCLTAMFHPKVKRAEGIPGERKLESDL